ncbi:yqkF [Symbiodinium sp. KB8]|nr:yqkF [Symbiodinium sp. KB8]
MSFLVVQEAPRLGLGLAALGRPGYINLDRGSDLEAPETRTPEALRARAWEVLDAAWSLGLRYFDCARSYGRSEEFLSGWLKQKQLRKDDLAVGSKWGYRYTADWRVDTGGEPHEVKDHSLSHLLHQEKETEQLLGEHLRLYQIHSATLDSGVLDNADVLEKLRELRTERGWRVGLSLSGVGQADTLDKAIATKTFDSVQATWNLLEQSCGSALLRAHEAGMEVIIKEGMANGRILQNAALLQAAEKMGVPPDALALGAIMAQPFKPMVLSGAVSIAQLESNFGAVGVCQRLLTDMPTLELLMSEMKVDELDAPMERVQTSPATGGNGLDASQKVMSWARQPSGANAPKPLTNGALGRGRLPPSRSYTTPALDSNVDYVTADPLPRLPPGKVKKAAPTPSWMSAIF